jgi:hypothetical protein
LRKEFGFEYDESQGKILQAILDKKDDQPPPAPKKIEQPKKLKEEEERPKDSFLSGYSSSQLFKNYANYGKPPEDFGNPNFGKFKPPPSYNTYGSFLPPGS